MSSPTPRLSLGTTASARVVTYAYDGLQRLTGASENPGTSASYSYDLAGNRTDGGKTYNAANQLIGLTYDNAGNLTNDGTAAFTYDALGRMTARGSTTYSYNGDGVLVYDGTTRYTQDLVSPLSQVLQTTQGSATTQYLYGLGRLASVAGSTRTWYGTDALGSVRQTLSDTGVPLGVINYDAWGKVETGTVPTFGFTGEIQDAASGVVNLRARWYSTTRGTFTAVDPFAGVAETPYSQHAYQYGYSDPVLLSDPSGQVVPVDGPEPSSCRMSDPQFLQCILNETHRGAQRGQQDSNNHECIGDPEAIEIRLPLAGGGTAPACLDAPQAQLNPWYGQRKAKAPSIWEIILQGCGILTAAAAGEEEDDQANGSGPSKFPPTTPPNPRDIFKYLRELAQETRAKYIGKPEGSNVAAAWLDLDGQEALEQVATSKKTPLDRPVPASEGGQFQPGIAPETGRLMDTDAEYKLFSWAGDEIGKSGQTNPRGTLYLYTEMDYCSSCRNIANVQWSTKFPNVNVIYDFGRPFIPWNKFFR